jgi:acyl-coenzyme A thioesterase 13
VFLSKHSKTTRTKMTRPKSEKTQLMSENTPSKPQIVTQGAFEGWSTWGNGSDPFETLAGPFYMRALAAGGYECAFMPETQHANGMGNIHGGALMTFADFALFAHAHDSMSAHPCVTMQFESQFVGGAKVGILIESQAEIVRETRAMIFLRGVLTQSGKPVLAYSAILKRIGI